MGNRAGGDQIEGNIEGGEQVAVGSRNRQDSRHYDDSHRGGSVTFQGDYGDAAIWREIVSLGKDISAVNIRLDDLPDRVKVIEVRLMAGSPSAANTSTTALYWILGAGFFSIVAMTVVQIVLQQVG